MGRTSKASVADERRRQQEGMSATQVSWEKGEDIQFSTVISVLNV